MSEAPDELPLDVPPRLFSCTPSKLTTYLDCARRYRFTYLDRPTPAKGKPWAHLSLGTTLHNALRQWWYLEPVDRTQDAASRLVVEQWRPEGFRNDQQQQDYRAMAQDWARQYARTLDPADEPLGVERTVGCRTDRLALSGRADRIDARVIAGQNEAVIVDYKTGRQTATADDARASLALAIYSYATARMLRRPSPQVELHHLPSGTVATWRHDEHSVARHLRRATEIADDIQEATSRLAAGGDPDEGFPTSPGPGCSWCDFREVCPDGQAASPAVSSWAGLP